MFGDAKLQGDEFFLPPNDEANGIARFDAAEDRFQGPVRLNEFVIHEHDEVLGDHPGWGGTLARVIGWAFAIWGTALYWWAAMLYLAQVRNLVGDRGVHT